MQLLSRNMNFSVTQSLKVLHFELLKLCFYIKRRETHEMNIILF
jgi:hypothetical protein